MLTPTQHTYGANKRVIDTLRLWVNGVAGVEKYGRQVWVVHPPSEKIMTELTGEELILNHARDMETLARKCVRRALTCNAWGGGDGGGGQCCRVVVVVVW